MILTEEMQFLARNAISTRHRVGKKDNTRATNTTSQVRSDTLHEMKQTYSVDNKRRLNDIGAEAPGALWWQPQGKRGLLEGKRE